MSTALIPIVLAGLYGVVMFQFSAWSLKRQLSKQSNPLIDKNLEKIMAKFANVLEVDRIRLNIFETEPINGLAAPDGRIFITRGFYNKYQNGDITVEEISSVVAHELGHVALGHIRRRMIDFSGQNAVRAALGALLSRLIPGLGGFIASFIGNLNAEKAFTSIAYFAVLRYPLYQLPAVINQIVNARVMIERIEEFLLADVLEEKEFEALQSDVK